MAWHVLTLSCFLSFEPFLVKDTWPRDHMTLSIKKWIVADLLEVSNQGATLGFINNLDTNNNLIMPYLVIVM